MPACEKCWNDAYRRALDEPMRDQADHYQDLLRERKDSPCADIDYRKRGMKNVKPIICLDLDGTVLRRFESINHAARFTGLSQPNLSKTVNGKNKSCGGFLWRFVDQK